MLHTKFEVDGVDLGLVWGDEVVRGQVGDDEEVHGREEDDEEVHGLEEDDEEGHGQEEDDVEGHGQEEDDVEGHGRELDAAEGVRQHVLDPHEGQRGEVEYGELWHVEEDHDEDPDALTLDEEIWHVGSRSADLDGEEGRDVSAEDPPE